MTLTNNKPKKLVNTFIVKDTSAHFLYIDKKLYKKASNKRTQSDVK